MEESLLFTCPNTDPSSLSPHKIVASDQRTAKWHESATIAMMSTVVAGKLGMFVVAMMKKQ
jgi:hypothetical protein